MASVVKQTLYPLSGRGVKSTVASGNLYAGGWVSAQTVAQAHDASDSTFDRLGVGGDRDSTPGEGMFGVYWRMDSCTYAGAIDKVRFRVRAAFWLDAATADLRWWQGGSTGIARGTAQALVQDTPTWHEFDVAVNPATGVAWAQADLVGKDLGWISNLITVDESTDALAAGYEFEVLVYGPDVTNFTETPDTLSVVVGSVEVAEKESEINGVYLNQNSQPEETLGSVVKQTLFPVDDTRVEYKSADASRATYTTPATAAQMHDADLSNSTLDSIRCPGGGGARFNGRAGIEWALDECTYNGPIDKLVFVMRAKHAYTGGPGTTRTIRIGQYSADDLDFVAASGTTSWTPSSSGYTNPTTQFTTTSYTDRASVNALCSAVSWYASVYGFSATSSDTLSVSTFYAEVYGPDVTNFTITPGAIQVVLAAPSLTSVKSLLGTYSNAFRCLGFHSTIFSLVATGAETLDTVTPQFSFDGILWTDLSNTPVLTSTGVATGVALNSGGRRLVVSGNGVRHIPWKYARLKMEADTLPTGLSVTCHVK